MAGAPFLIIGLFFVCWVINFLSWVLLVVLGFQRHWGWGSALIAPTVLSLAALFLSPQTQLALLPVLWAISLLGLVVLIAFIVVAWPEAKRPFFWLLGSICAAVLIGIGTVFFAAATAQQIKG